MKAYAKIRIPLVIATSVAWGSAAARAEAANETRAPAAAAQGQVSVAQLNEEGAALYAARDYRRAIEKFIQAYAVDTDPNLLFNIARCYEELGEVDAAIEKYENFLKTPGADTRGRQRARESLQTLRDARDGNSVDEAAVEGGVSQASTPSDAAPAEPQPAAKANESSVLPWITLGGSVALAAVGTTFYILGASDHGKVTDAPGFGDPNAVSGMTRREADDLVSAGDTKKLIGGISFGVAAALAATYVVLLVTDDEGSPEPAPSLGFSLAPSPHGGAVSVQGSF
jgi:tetratricopeptide (TPR) repeat protein